MSARRMRPALQCVHPRAHATRAHGSARCSSLLHADTLHPCARACARPRAARSTCPECRAELEPVDDAAIATSAPRCRCSPHQARGRRCLPCRRIPHPAQACPCFPKPRAMMDPALNQEQSHAGAGACTDRTRSQERVLRERHTHTHTSDFQGRARRRIGYGALLALVAVFSSNAVPSRLGAPPVRAFVCLSLACLSVCQTLSA